jgi:pyocin large subunit-like protein
MKSIFLIGAACAALAVAGCDAGPAAVSKAPQAGAQAAASSGGAAAATAAPTTQAGAQGPAAAGGAQVASADPRDAPVPLATDGKPMWAANRKHTAQENADYQFNKNGKDFGASSEAEYVAKTHAFVDAPPSGVKRIARSNGDALLYDARSNTFAVVTKAGAPRTMFKPHDGAAYWDQQVAREQSRAKNQDDSQS